jgi:hypothetical protein
MELKRIYLASIAIVLLTSSHGTESQEICSNSSMIAKSRMKRFLIFQPGSRILVRSAHCEAQKIQSVSLSKLSFESSLETTFSK